MVLSILRISKSTVSSQRKRFNKKRYPKKILTVYFLFYDALNSVLYHIDIQLERQQRLEKQRIKDEQLRLQRKLEEKERWWAGSDLFVNQRDTEDLSIVTEKVTEKARLLDRYANDYSRWNDWKPSDPVTLAETAEVEAEIEKKKNEEFEKNNNEFCSKFLDDMEERNKSLRSKQEKSESARLKGNRFFKRKEYDAALTNYMDALKLQPYDPKTLLNVAQVRLFSYDITFIWR